MPANRVAGGFDHHVESIRANQGIAVVGKVGGPGLKGIVEVRCGELAGRPLRAPEGFARPVNGDIGHTQDMQVRNAPGLGQEHRAEFSGADETHPNGIPGFGARRSPVWSTISGHGTPLESKRRSCPDDEEAGVKVGQTFLSAFLIVLLTDYRQN